MTWLLILTLRCCEQAGDIHIPAEPIAEQPPHPKRLRSIGQRREDCAIPESMAQAPAVHQLTRSSMGVFCGLTFVFWTTKFMSSLMTRSVSHHLPGEIPGHLVSLLSARLEL